MKKLPLLCLSLLAFVFTLNAQEISFSFTANHTCEYAASDSVLIENLTQGGDTTLYWNDTVLTIVLTGIDPVSGGQNGFSVSQNYPNPFETKTDIDVFVPERDDFTLNVYDVSGRKVADYEGTHERGMQHFTFFAGNAKSYILTVSSGKYLQHIQMIQFGEAGSASPRIEYHGATTTEEPEIKQKSLRSYFPYELEDELKFTAYVSGDYTSITDTPSASEDYFFDINNAVPAQPGTISGNTTVCENATAETYSISAVDDATSYTWTVPSGASIVSGQGDTEITVDFGTSSGDICVTADNACGASTQTCQAISVNTPTATAGSNSPVCEGEDIDLTETGGDATAWNWDGPDSFSSNSQDTTITSATTADGGTYTVTVTDGNGCTNTDNVSVTVNTAPSAPSAGTHVPGQDTIAWNWTTVPDATGYMYNTSDDYATATDNGTDTTYTQTGLSCETAYTLYVWAYNDYCESSSLVLNETTDDCPFVCGTSTVDDFDGNTYNTVQIGNQCWIKENLKTTHYTNGSSILLVENNNDWDNLDYADKAYCYYGNSSANGDTYGALYTWAAAMNGEASSNSNPSGVQGICPDGWHLPSDDEWKELEGEVDATYPYGDPVWDDTGFRGYDAGSALAGNESLWTDGYLDAHSSFGNSGFTGLPGGRRYITDGAFLGIEDNGQWWSATENSAGKAWEHQITYSIPTMARNDFYKNNGYSVRCVKD